jgi:uncharacterized repeat protein (TIGR03837 family)
VDNLLMRSLQWDIFCKVIDNFGDIGVSWRLAADLAARGHQVRLWVDDASGLAWMAPRGCAGVRVLPWTADLDFSALSGAPCDVLVETFGCEVAPDFIAACARSTCGRGLDFTENADVTPPVWINLEYLTAEPYAERCHGLPSPVQTGLAAGWKKWFFYPGFSDKTGGLLREADLATRRASFDRAAWLAQFDVNCQGRVVVFLFCYEPAGLPKLLRQLNTQGAAGQPVTLLVAAGRATESVKQNFNKIGLYRNEYGPEQLLNLLQVVYLPELTQHNFDHALWAADINFVRGEDSLVRAIWAGKPFVWQVYPQIDGAHLPKMEAFLSMSNAPPSLCAFYRWWNGAVETPDAPMAGDDLAAWQLHAQGLSTALSGTVDLATQLERFALKNR